eukprot:64501-Prymnesium_polylepis.1
MSLRRAGLLSESSRIVRSAFSRVDREPSSSSTGDRVRNRHNEGGRRLCADNIAAASLQLRPRPTPPENISVGREVSEPVTSSDAAASRRCASRADGSQLPSRRR